MKVESWAEGPRFAQFPEALRKGALEFGVKVTMDVQKRFFRETVFFTVEGDDQRVRAFGKAIEKAAEEYNQ